MALAEQRVLDSISHEIINESIRVVWYDEIARDGEVISRTPHPCTYNREHKERFISDLGAEVAAPYIAIAGW